MRRRIILAGALAGLPAIAIGGEKKNAKTLQQRLEGKWVRPQHPLCFEVKDNIMTEFKEDNPFKPFNSGTIQFPPGKDYAIVTLKTGHKLWLFSAGEDVVAIESFHADGRVMDSGRVYYRQGTHTP
jgi:hypothetical protein